jgi:hypothetical protein
MSRIVISRKAVAGVAGLFSSGVPSHGEDRLCGFPQEITVNPNKPSPSYCKLQWLLHGSISIKRNYLVDNKLALISFELPCDCEERSDTATSPLLCTRREIASLCSQ